MLQENEIKVKFLDSDSLNRSEDKKLDNKKLVRYLNNNDLDITRKTIDRIVNCGTFLEFYSDISLENIKLHSGNFCGNRFCPICSANKSRKDSFILKTIVNYLSNDYRFLFLTLTVKNVFGYNLNDCIKKMNISFKRFQQYKIFKKSVKGYVRKLEVTYNPISDTFHPHFHLILAVNKSYFNDTRYYISRAKFLEMWQKANDDYSISQVDIRKFKNDESKSIFEITKYFSKNSNYLYSSEVFKVFYTSLKGKQLITYNGIFKDTLLLYNSGNLDYLKTVSDIEFFYKIYSLWHDKQGYKFVKLVELEDFEKSLFDSDILD